MNTPFLGISMLIHIGILLVSKIIDKLFIVVKKLLKTKRIFHYKLVRSLFDKRKKSLYRKIFNKKAPKWIDFYEKKAISFASMVIIVMVSTIVTISAGFIFSAGMNSEVSNIELAQNLIDRAPLNVIVRQANADSVSSLPVASNLKISPEDLDKYFFINSY